MALKSLNGPTIDKPVALWGDRGTGPSAAIDPRRLLGVYYTPGELAAVLVAWAIVHRSDTVLDPSFGGCAFLAAATRRLAALGSRDPGRLVHGVDIDEGCVAYVRAQPQLVASHCVVCDFLELSPDDLRGGPFHAIVGNPPFVRHHWLKGAARRAAERVVRESGVRVPATASTWAYFVLHALSFLAPGGRLAMLVPEAILQADYAEPIRQALAARFRRTRLVYLRDRLFDRTDEPVVVVAASGYGHAGTVSVAAIERAADLPKELRGGTSANRAMLASKGRPVSTAAAELVAELAHHERVRPVAEVATVRIGFVTGANGHFLCTAPALVDLGIPAGVRVPVVTRTTWLSGLAFTAGDHRHLAALGRRAFLVRPTPAFEAHGGVRRWIARGVIDGVHLRHKCECRDPWYRVALPPTPDAFATCTRAGSPRLVINEAGYRCSNALHSLRWKPELDVSAKVFAVGFMTSLVAVWAELHGRRYGGGVLKLEPGTLQRAPVPLVHQAETIFDEADDLLRAGDEDAARQRADEVVLGHGLGLSKPDIRCLSDARVALMAQRHPSVGGRRG